MPHRTWTHDCEATGRRAEQSTPGCDRCGKPGDPGAWRYGMHEAMARYQTKYRLKPIGPHKKMANELFRNLTAKCSACEGEGIVDAPPGWSVCKACRGLGYPFTVPPEVVGELREQILEVYPDAAAEPVAGFPGPVVIHDLSRGVIVSDATDDTGTTGSVPDARVEELAASMHPAYFRTRFRIQYELPEWPEEFAIISAHATTGEEWTKEDNERANDELVSVFEESGVWFDVLTGFSPETGHAELSYAVALPLDRACDLGVRFRQDAIFHVRGDLLSVTYCDERRALVPVGPFREPVEAAPADEGHTRLSRTDGPWGPITAQRFEEALDRLIEHDASAPTPSGRILVFREAISSGRVLLEALPEGARAAAQEDIESDYVTGDDLADLFPEAGAAIRVIGCAVDNTMVSSEWGLDQLTLGNRGYFIYEWDFGACAPGVEGGVPWILGAWEPVDDQAAREACLLACYARYWDHIPLPPMGAERVEGDPAILFAGLSAALDSERGRSFWERVVDRVRKQALGGREASEWVAAGGVYGVSSESLLRVLEELGDPDSDLAKRAEAGDAFDDERAGLAALYLACTTG